MIRLADVGGVNIKCGSSIITVRTIGHCHERKAFPNGYVIFEHSIFGKDGTSLSFRFDLSPEDADTLFWALNKMIQHFDEDEPKCTSSTTTALPFAELVNRPVSSSDISSGGQTAPTQ